MKKMKRLLKAFGLATMFCFGLTAGAQEISTIAGTGVQGYNGDNIAADTAQIESCIHVHADRFGNVFYADLGINCVRKIDASGLVTTIAGNGTSGYSGDSAAATNAQLNTPRGIAADWHGNVYIADAGNNCIRKVSASGVITTVAGTGAAGSYGDGGPATNATLNFPCGIAVDSLGNLFIADTYNNCIRKVSATYGTIFTIAGTAGTAGAYSGDGGYGYACQLNNPTDVVVDPASNIYIADMINARVRMIDSFGLGHINTVAGTGGPGYYGDGGPATLARLNIPVGLALDYRGNLFIADMGNQRVRMVSPYGKISTIAGNGTNGYNGDEIPAWSAELNSPQSVGVDPQNNVYIADYGNYRVRKLDIVHAAVNNKAAALGHLELYPNPVISGDLSIVLTTGFTETMTYTVAAADGTVVESGTGTTNGVFHTRQKLNSGTYFVSIVTATGTTTGRFVKL